jgi:hypothetical protein
VYLERAFVLIEEHSASEAEIDIVVTGAVRDLLSSPYS